jgi:hypothetical protein
LSSKLECSQLRVFGKKYIKKEEKLKLSEPKTNKETELETSIQEQIKAMAKAMIVSIAWSGAELLDKKPAEKTKPKDAPPSEEGEKDKSKG